MQRQMHLTNRFTLEDDGYYRWNESDITAPQRSIKTTITIWCRTNNWAEVALNRFSSQFQVEKTIKLATGINRLDVFCLATAAKKKPYCKYGPLPVRLALSLCLQHLCFIHSSALKVTRQQWQQSVFVTPCCSNLNHNKFYCVVITFLSDGDRHLLVRDGKL